MFVATFEGDILHFDGVLWTRVFADENTNIRSLWGTSPDDVYAVGDWGRILHYTGR